MLISSTLFMGPERIYRSSIRRKSSVNIPMRARNFSQGKMQRMVEFCVHSDAVFWNHGRVCLSLANRTTVVLLRAFRSGFQLLPGTWGLVPVLPYHAILATYIQVQFARQYTTLILQPSYPMYHHSQPHPSGDQRSCCHVTSHIPVTPACYDSLQYVTGVSLLPHVLAQYNVHYHTFLVLRSSGIRTVGARDVAPRGNSDSFMCYVLNIAQWHVHVQVATSGV
jgi:hypothetical protein